MPINLNCHKASGKGDAHSVVEGPFWLTNLSQEANVTVYMYNRSVRQCTKIAVKWKHWGCKAKWPPEMVCAFWATFVGNVPFWANTARRHWSHNVVRSHEWHRRRWYFQMFYHCPQKRELNDMLESVVRRPGKDKKKGKFISTMEKYWQRIKETLCYKRTMNRISLLRHLLPFKIQIAQTVAQTDWFPMKAI